MIRALEQFNTELTNLKIKKNSQIESLNSFKAKTTLDNFENNFDESTISLKLNPELYKIRIGKKKTGLPNMDYPPIILSNKIKNSNFTILSVEYDEIHIDNYPNVTDKYNDSEYIIDSRKSVVKKNKLDEKLIQPNQDRNRDNQYSQIIINDKKCCKCLIF